MVPSIFLILIITQLSSTGIYYIYDYSYNLGYFGGRNDTVRYNEGELWWWQNKDIDWVSEHRLKKCNKFVANPDNSAIKSIFCIIQSCKIRVKIEAIIVAKDAASFVAAHKDFIVFLVSVMMMVAMLKRAYERKKKGGISERLDALSYRSPHFAKQDSVVCANDNDLTNEILMDMKMTQPLQKKVSKSFYKTQKLAFSPKIR